MMGEIDTKSNQSVWITESLHGDRNDQKPRRSNSSDIGNGKGLESLSKDLSRWKMTVEAWDGGAPLQSRLSLENYQKMVGELSTLLRISETERNRYMDECVKARIHIHGLDSKLKEMDYQASQNEFLHMQLSHTLSELKAVQAEVVGVKGELAVARDSEFLAIKQAESMAAAADNEREKTRQLVLQVKELNEAILGSHLAAIEAEKEKFELLSQKDSQIQLARTAAVQAQEQLGTMRKQIKVMKDLNNLKMGKTMFAESAMLLLNSLEEDNSDVSSYGRQYFADTDQSSYIEALETEISKLKLELSKANKEMVKSFMNFEMDNDKPANEVSEFANSEIRQQQESLQDRAQEQGDESAYMVDFQYERSPYNTEALMIGSSERQAEDERNDEDINTHITISLEEYEYLIKKSSTSEVEVKNHTEVALLKEQLQVTITKMRELRNRAEQALSRAESAEKAKTKLEQQIKRWRDKKEKRQAALLALRQEFTPKIVPPSSPPYDDASPYDMCATPQPLGRILSMNY